MSRPPCCFARRFPWSQTGCSRIGISRSQTTNLAVVAPGIAEALLATALGLAAAIPAVVIYNHFSRRIAAYRALVGDTSAAVLRLVSRDLGKCR